MIYEHKIKKDKALNIIGKDKIKINTKGNLNKDTLKESLKTFCFCHVSRQLAFL